MNIIKPLLISTTILLSASAFAEGDKYAEGEKLFKSICAACHGKAGGMDMSKRIAPPIAGVRKHYKDAYPDEASFVAAVSSWVEKQDENKSLMRGAIRKFKIMPPISVPKEDVAKIAAYIYAGNIDKPEGLEEHMQEMHANENKKEHQQGMKKMGQHDGQNMEQHGMDKAMRMQKAQMQRMKNSMRRKHGMNKMMMQQLNLSTEQKQKMQQLIQKKRETMQPLREQLQQIKRAINQLDTTNADYKKKVFSYADQKAKLIYRMTIEKGESRMHIESVLNPEQRAKFKQIRQNRFNN